MKKWEEHYREESDQTDVRLQNVEARAEKSNEDIANMVTASRAANAAQMEVVRKLHKLEEEMQQLRVRSEQTEEALKSASSSGSASVGPSATPQRFAAPATATSVASPAEAELAARTARMGRLGWDTESDILKQRAVDLLKEAGAENDTEGVTSIVNRRTLTGSMCEIIFKSEDSLYSAKRKVNARTRIMPEMKEPVWLDRAKTRTELAPARMLNALTAAVKELEESRTPQGTVERSNVGKGVRVNGRKLFAVSETCEVIVGSEARERYSPESIADCVGWAQAAR